MRLGRCHRVEGRNGRHGFTLIELLVVMLVGSFVIGALVATLMSVLRGSSGLSHYADMKQQADRLLGFFEADVTRADDIRFVATDPGEDLAFQLWANGIPFVIYTYGVDPNPPKGLSGTYYAVYREPFGQNKYRIAAGLDAPPVLERSGKPDITSFFYFYNNANQVYDPDNAVDRAQAESSTSKIRFNGRMRRGTGTDYPMSHEVSTLAIMKGRLARNAP